MTPAQRMAVVGLVFSIGVACVSGLLRLWLRHDQRGRSEQDSPQDAQHFERQDRRRGLIATILLVLAALILIGSGVDPRPAGRPNPAFVLTWLTAFGLILVLLWLALVDWVATRHYARRQFHHLSRERLAILRDTLREASRIERESPGDSIEPPRAD